jgi:xylulokinase
VFDPLARGTVVGLTLSHTRGHLFRAVLEGIGFGFRHHLDVLAELSRLPDRARCTNGGARSRLWRQITADVLGLSLETVADHPGSSLGAAYVAGMAIKAFSDWSGIANYVQVDEVTEPDPRAHAEYERLYPVFREVYTRLKDVYPRLNAEQPPGTSAR